MMTFNTNNTTCDNKLIGMLVLGVITALQNEQITIRESEKCIFSPYMSKKLREKNISENLIDIVECGCELENIKSLIPDKYSTVLEDLKNRTSSAIDSFSRVEVDRWLEIL